MIYRDEKQMVSKIFSWLYIGDGSDARDRNLIESLGITHIINCVSHALPCPWKDIQYYKMTLKSITQTISKEEMKPIVDFIDKAREEGGKVLVHCHEGKERSPSVVIAYLCEKGMPLKEAYELVKSKRPIIKPRPEMLIEYTVAAS